MAEKKGFVIYFDWREQFELLPPEDRGKLLWGVREKARLTRLCRHGLFLYEGANGSRCHKIRRTLRHQCGKRFKRWASEKSK